MDARQLYQQLLPFVMSEQQMLAHKYPRQDPQDPTRLEVPFEYKQQVAISNPGDKRYTCERCKKVYRVDQEGVPLASEGQCVYHRRPVWNSTRSHPCCQRSAGARGCLENFYHVHGGAQELATYCDFIETQAKPERDDSGHGIYAFDCAMCHTTRGFELARVTVVDHNRQVVYEQLVKPDSKILDYNTQWSGITKDQMDCVTTRLADVQRHLLELFSNKTILIGHGLEYDLKVLKLFHRRYIDTSQLYPHRRGLPLRNSLKKLMEMYLRSDVQQGDSPDSKADARAALKLVLRKI